MAFDVTLPFDSSRPDTFKPSFDLPAEVARQVGHGDVEATNRRRLGLFEGHDNQGRLQPLLGTIDPAEDINGDPICWPNDEKHEALGLVGPMVGTATWHGPTTENIKLGAVEEWEIWNVSADAHPIHLHMVHFGLVSRKEIVFDSGAVEGEIEPEDLETAVVGDGTYYTDMPLVMHDGSLGEGYRVVNPTAGAELSEEDFPEYINNFPRDVVVALPGQITTIKAHFDKPGRFNWHCHILAHEDHEMMRIFHVGDLPADQRGGECPMVDETDGDPPAGTSCKSDADCCFVSSPNRLGVTCANRYCDTSVLAFGVCVHKKEAGESCTSINECMSEMLCTEGKCSPKADYIPEDPVDPDPSTPSPTPPGATSGARRFGPIDAVVFFTLLCSVAVLPNLNLMLVTVPW
mmetsp:Transcript_34963/g.75764  ORF Transcript_34963/g.75764 Transcript_34963/m.75764 type:complete len:404 (+) Transcript_34963:392-1603(+)